MTCYHQPFFDLQCDLAVRVSALSAIPLSLAVLNYTNFYVRFGLGRSFDPVHPVWQEYLAGLKRSNDPRGWTHAFYRTRLPDAGTEPVVVSVGCFSYACLCGNRIRLHFAGGRDIGQPPLATHRQGHRLAELRGLFEQVRLREPSPPLVIGGSWLYNLLAYRRLFPASYLETATAVAGKFQSMAIWGQFMDRHGVLRPGPVNLLKSRLASLSSLEGFAHCFPHRVLALEASAVSFYDFYRCDSAA